MSPRASRTGVGRTSLDVWKSALSEAGDVLGHFLSDHEQLVRCVAFTDLLADTFAKGGHVFTCGNGGSHGDAVHFAGEWTGRYRQAEDPIPLGVVERSGRNLGKGLAVLIDVLNPELIVVGSIGVRLGERLLAPAREVIRKEALPVAAAVCRIVPAELGERIGDFAALCVALEGEAAQRAGGTGLPQAEAG